MIDKQFSSLKAAPRDPILGLTELFKADENPNKVNLGVGVYYSEEGKVPLLQCVGLAEQQLIKQANPRAYLPIDGLNDYCKNIQNLLFGNNAPAIKSNRIATVQTLGGTGALRIGGDFLRETLATDIVWVSNPSWENHKGVFEKAGFKVKTYPYYDPNTHRVSFAEMVNSLEKMESGSIVVLHACCHNPTGVDLSAQEWDQIIQVVKEKNICPFLDIAYQGFGESLREDGLVLKKFADSGIHFLVANSFSKSFSLYGERVGGLSVVTANEHEKITVLSRLKKIVRANYSNPPTHGAKIVSTVLSSKELFDMWEIELRQMRDRIRSMREILADNIRRINKSLDFSHIVEQRGMFSYTGLTKEQVVKMRENHSVYAIETGRICVAALNSKNVNRVASAISEVY